MLDSATRSLQFGLAALCQRLFTRDPTRPLPQGPGWIAASRRHKRARPQRRDVPVDVWTHQWPVNSTTDSIARPVVGNNGTQNRDVRCVFGSQRECWDAKHVSNADSI